MPGTICRRRFESSLLCCYGVFWALLSVLLKYNKPSEVCSLKKSVFSHLFHTEKENPMQEKEKEKKKGGGGGRKKKKGEKKRKEKKRGGGGEEKKREERFVQINSVTQIYQFAHIRCSWCISQ